MERSPIRFWRQVAAGSPDHMVSQMGLTGLQFINVVNGCATGGSALIQLTTLLNQAPTTWASQLVLTSMSVVRLECKRASKVKEIGMAEVEWR